MSEHRVIAVNFLSSDIYELILERNGLSFVPGDCVSIFKSPKECRPYSIASGSEEDHLRFLIKKLDDGNVSKYLAGCQKGDNLQLSPTFGWFRPGQSEANGNQSVFIATGTGIAPFISYMRSYPDKPLCLYGVRYEESIIDQEFLEQQSDFFPAVSREDTDYFRGRVTELIKSMELIKDTHYYLCGLDSMIDEMALWLEDNGVAFANIHREVFFHADSA